MRCESGLRAAKLLNGCRLQIVFLLGKEPMTKKQLAGQLAVDGDQLAEALYALRNAGLVCVENENGAPTAAPADGRIEDKVALSDALRPAQASLRWRLTELGEELLPLCKELERFGRLYDAAQELLPELMGESDIPWMSQDAPENADGASCSSPAKAVSATDRHSFYQAGSVFVFFNPHREFEDWYFYGETTGEETTLYLITEPEYRLFLSALQNGEPVPKERAMLKLQFSLKTADLNWEEENAYQLAEDTLIGLAMSNCPNGC